MSVPPAETVKVDHVVVDAVDLTIRDCDDQPQGVKEVVAVVRYTGPSNETSSWSLPWDSQQVIALTDEHENIFHAVTVSGALHYFGRVTENGEEVLWNASEDPLSGAAEAGEVPSEGGDLVTGDPLTEGTQVQDVMVMSSQTQLTLDLLVLKALI